MVNNGSTSIAAKARTGFCLLYERKIIFERKVIYKENIYIMREKTYNSGACKIYRSMPSIYHIEFFGSYVSIYGIERVLE